VPADRDKWEVQVKPCDGGWYWELFYDGIKMNGGLSSREGSAYAEAWVQVHAAARERLFRLLLGLDEP
jgi:hypothetical protein